MEILSDDPTYLAGGLGLLAGVFLIALRLTQQGKYLVWAAVSLALALVVVGVERVWVTDNERIEETVYGLGRAVASVRRPRRPRGAGARRPVRRQRQHDRPSGFTRQSIVSAVEQRDGSIS